MNEILARVDQDLTELEERLLAELRLLRKQSADTAYSPLPEAFKEELMFSVDSLLHELNHSGDTMNLSLRTEEHESLESRLDVIRKILGRKIPTALIEASHQEVKASRDRVTRKVAAARKNTEPGEKQEASRKGFFGKLFDRKRTEGEKARNPQAVTHAEEAKFDEDPGYQDSGVFSASRELAILSEQMMLHHEEGQSVEQIVKERASFRSRDLSGAPVMEKARVAQTPEEIRKKLEGKSGSRGASTFASRDIEPQYQSDPPKPPEKRGPIAQTPEEIRKKLQNRQAAAGSGKASFGSKDITPLPGSSPFVKSEEPARNPEPEKPAGKAVFGSRDITPESEKFPNRQKEKQEETRPAGKATFQARDLQDDK